MSPVDPYQIYFALLTIIAVGSNEGQPEGGRTSSEDSHVPENYDQDLKPNGAVSEVPLDNVDTRYQAL